MEAWSFDPRIHKNVLSRTPFPTILMSMAYLAFVKILGPAWMKNRKPYNLKGLLILHNSILVIVNSWLFYRFGKYGWFSRYSWTCAEIDFLETEDSMAIVWTACFFYGTKVLDMLDTVFFVLRKKDSNITFLHLVHHSMVPILTWYFGSLGASGYNTLFGLLNSFVHIWMYLYYGLAALGPSVQKHLWWKRYITRLQIVQFCIITLATISVIVTPGCKVPLSAIAINLVPALFFLLLFVDFYRRSYLNQNKSKSFKNGISRNHINSEDLNGNTGKNIISKLLNGSSSNLIISELLNGNSGKVNGKMSHND